MLSPPVFLLAAARAKSSLLTTDYTAPLRPALLVPIGLWYGRPMDARQSETPWPEDFDERDDFEEAEEGCDPNWVKHVSFEDDHGIIHEIEIPGAGIPRAVFVPLMMERLRESKPYRFVVETLSDKLVVVLLGFLTFMMLNMLFGPKYLSGKPAPWCVFSITKNACVADIG